MRSRSLVRSTSLVVLALVGCNEDIVSQTTLSGGSEGELGTDSDGVNVGNDDTTGGRTTGDGSGGGDQDAGGEDTSDDGVVDDTGGNDGGEVEGPTCAETQMGLCRNPGVTVHCYSGASETCEMGACVGGTQTCEMVDLDLGQWSACEGEVTPAAETCDGLDNDCDGETDEDLGTTQCGVGECVHTSDDCVGGEPQDCDPLEGMSAETCDGLDNDCDGDIDEDFSGETVSCGVGVCFHSVAACEMGMEPLCDPLQGQAAEICDTLDNDCDGETDEGFGTTICGLGICEHEVPDCDGGFATMCDPFEGQEDEVCDGFDNDCDGSTDEGFGPILCGVGECEHEIEQCIDGVPQDCDPELGAVPEICDDMLDNDCDGETDEDCFCGNDSISGSEECDGTDLGGQSCATMGYDGGMLGCNPDCTFDTNGCYDCGDAMIDPGEACDGGNLGGETCVGLGFDGGTLTCSPICAFDTSNCYGCNDGTLDPGEECDGADLDGQSCGSLGFDGGTLACSGSCTLDTSGCYACGDGMINPGESCDGANLGGQDCTDLGFGGGTLACNATCGYDTSGCYDCGDGAIDPGESCDGANLGGQDCTDLGFDGGSLSCNGLCAYDTSGCYACGDGAIDPGESCDGANLGGQDCTDLGFDGGTLACDATCGYDTSGCYACGDGSIDPGESCDGADLGGQTCAGLGFDGGTLACDATCGYDTSGCYACGNGSIDPGEECDGTDLGGETCVSQGFDSGTLDCYLATCVFDVSGCVQPCEAPTSHLVCDAADGDQFQAMGLNCPGNATDSTSIFGESFISPDGNAWRVASEFGDSGTWVPTEGNAMLVLSTGTLPALDAQDRVVLAPGAGQIGTANANPGVSGPPGPDSPVGLPAPVMPVDGSNFGVGGTPYVNCDGVDDCSDTIESEWNATGAGAYDLLHFTFQATAPAGTHGYVFDVAWFDAEYPEYIGTPFTDALVVWSQSEAFVGNIMDVGGLPFSSNTMASLVQYTGLDPELSGTGYDGVGAGTGWFTVTAEVVPNETFQLDFVLYETGDHFYDGTVLLDNFRFDCDGCVVGDDCGITQQ